MNLLELGYSQISAVKQVEPYIVKGLKKRILFADAKLANFVSINKSLIDSSTVNITKHLRDKLKPDVARMGGNIRLSDKLDAN